MKVLFVTSGNGPSDVSNLALTQAESLINQNVNVEMYYIKGKGIQGYLKNIIPLRRQIRKNHYDIIHAHYGLSGWVALLAKNRKPKVVISFMGNDLLGDHANNGKSTMFGNILVKLNKSLAKYADQIIVKSDEMFDTLKHKNKSLIPNGVNLDLFSPAGKDSCLEKTSWDPQLRHILFLSNPERPEKNFGLTKAAINLLYIKDIQLHILEQIPHRELVYYYNAADVCILSSYHEGSPNVIKEAMACNCPIISTNVGDVKKVITGIEGCYVTSFDPTDVAEKLKLALEFAQKSRRTKGRERIVELGLDGETIAGRILEVYEKALGIQDKRQK